MKQLAVLLVMVSLKVHQVGGDPLVIPLKSASTLTYLEDHSDAIALEESFVQSLGDNESSLSFSGSSTLGQTSAVAEDPPSLGGPHLPETYWSRGGSRRLPPSPSGSSSSAPDDESLARLLVAIVTKEMRECVLVVALDDGFRDSAALDQLLLLPNPRQVVVVTGAEDLRGLVWEAPQCRGYLFLLQHPQPLLTFANYSDYLWDFRGRYVMAGLAKQKLLALTGTRKVAKTENLLAIVKQSERRGEWRLYTNQVVWAAGLTPVATWRSEGFTSSPDLYPDKLADLHGAVLTVITFQWEPGVLYQRDPDGGPPLRYGRDIQVVTALGHALNFSLHYRETPPGEVWGTRVGDGSSWNGMLGFLQRAEAHIGAANFFITNINNRLEVADFSTPYDADMSCFLARQPPPLPPWQRIIYPFQMETWLALLLGFLVSGPLLNGLARAGLASGGERPGLLSLPSTWLYTLGLHTSEAQAAVPRRRSTQVLVSFLWLYTIIVTTAYRSNLTAFLTVARPTPTIDTIRQLHASGLHVSGLGDFFGKALKSSENPYLKGLSEQFQEHRHLHQLWPGVAAGLTVYLETRRLHQYVITMNFSSHGFPSMRIIKECFAPYGIGLATQRSSPLKTKFDPLLLRMVESGLVQHWFTESLRKSKNDARRRPEQQVVGDAGVPAPASSGGEDPGESGGGGRTLSLDHMQGVFFLVVIGGLLSSLIYLGEVTVGGKLRGRVGP